MKISKDGHKMDVSPNAYEIMYKRLGYKKAFDFDEEPEKNNTSKNGKANTKNK